MDTVILIAVGFLMGVLVTSIYSVATSDCNEEE